jgi:hypothetical protein
MEDRSSSISRPRLDGPEHGARIKQVGLTHSKATLDGPCVDPGQAVLHRAWAPAGRDMA